MDFSVFESCVISKRLKAADNPALSLKKEHPPDGTDDCGMPSRGYLLHWEICGNESGLLLLFCQLRIRCNVECVIVVVDHHARLSTGGLFYILYNGIVHWYILTVPCL